VPSQHATACPTCSPRPASYASRAPRERLLRVGAVVDYRVLSDRATQVESLHNLIPAAGPPDMDRSVASGHVASSRPPAVPHPSGRQKSWQVVDGIGAYKSTVRGRALATLDPSSPRRSISLENRIGWNWNLHHRIEAARHLSPVGNYGPRDHVQLSSAYHSVRLPCRPVAQEGRQTGKRQIEAGGIRVRLAIGCRMSSRTQFWSF
jgi:hypothetical protein